MSQEGQSNSLQAQIVRHLIAKWQEESWDFLGENEAAVSDRVKTLEQDEQGLRIQLASDGWSLAQKEQIEASLKQWFRPDEGKKLLVHFKRETKLADRIQSTPSAQAASQQARSGAFGVQFQLQAIPGVAKIIAISSGKGGVGKSTVSVNLAAGLAAQGFRVGLLDADLYGPSAPMMLGVSEGLSFSPDQKMIPPQKHGVKVMSFGFMSDPYHPVIWRGPMVAKALQQLFYQTEWGELDYLLIDLPPGTGDVQLTMIEKLPLFGGIVVSTPQSVALLDAHKGLTMFEKLKVPVLGLVENMSHFQCSSCGHIDDVFGQAQIEVFAEERKVPIIGRIPLQKRIREACDAGIPVVVQDPTYALYYMSIIERLLEYADQ